MDSLMPDAPAEVRYSLPDHLKILLAGESEAIFRLIERRFGVVIQTRLPGLVLRAPAGGDLPGAVAFLDRLKISQLQGAQVIARRTRLSPIQHNRCCHLVQACQYSNSSP